MTGLRIGHGFDVHRLVTGRRLVLGGVQIPFDKGLEGHSDADVVAHAVMDALLGAAGLPDIGVYFPPSDERFRGADSLVLLSQVREELESSGFSEIVNVDVTVMAERPKLAAHMPKMRACLAGVLGIAVEQVNVKATTTEKLGFVGREEGIAAEAVCLISHGK